MPRSIRAGASIFISFLIASGSLPAAIDVPAQLGLDIDGSVQSFNVPVGNPGAGQSLTVSGASFTGPNAAAFSVLSTPASIAPGDADVIVINFNPSGLTGTVSATLVIQSNDVGNPSAMVPLSGFLHDPKLIVPVALDFGTLEPGSPPMTRALAVSNAGGGHTLTIAAPALDGTDASHFSIASAPASLPPLTAGTVRVTFDPQGSSGAFSARLRLSTNDPVSPSALVNLSTRVGVVESRVRINEFVASNDGTLNDGDGVANDWIELFNGGDAPADIGGWHLTDEAADLTKWTFPSGTTIAAKGHLVVFASGNDSDNYVDSGGSLHTNFKLDAAGEFLALVRPDGSVAGEFTPVFPTQFSDIAYGAHLAGGTALDVLTGNEAQVLVPTDGSLALTWTLPSFSPGAGWTTGPGHDIGYERSTTNTYDPYFTIDMDARMAGVSQSCYIRIPFSVTDASLAESLTLRVRYDDGFIAYLNGQMVASRNAPATPVWDSGATEAHGDTEAVVFEDIDVSTHLAALRSGANVLALHGLNQGAGGSDFLIAAELILASTGSGPISHGYLTAATPGAPNSAGVLLPGPEISQPSHTPAEPADADDIVVSARVVPRADPIGAVSLRWRINYGAETATAMNDAGADGDAVAGDSVYSARIPASASSPGQMVRWHVAAESTNAHGSRLPPFLRTTGKSQSPAYFGTVVADPAVSSQLPVFRWFASSASAAHTRAGARGSVYFNGRFYDNVFIRQRGAATNGTVSQKFDFNPGDQLRINDTDLNSLGEININGPGSDPAYIRQTLAFDTYRLAGNAACLSELWHMRVNGAFDRVGVFVEQVDEEFLQRNGYDPDGDLYKFVQRSNLDPVFFDTITGIEKETGNASDLSSVQALVAGLNQGTSEARRRFVIDNLDLPQINNFLAVRSITQDADDVRKNFYMFHDSPGDRLWRIFPWDKDWTFGVTGDGGTWLPHPFFGDQEHAKQNANQWNVLYDVLFEETITQQLYLRRLRTVMDEWLQPAGTPSAARILEARAQEIFAPADPELTSTISAVLSFLPSRRSVLFNNYPALIPASQPVQPDIQITAVEYNPVSGNQDEEFIRLSNSESTEIDISGWSIEGGADLNFAAGTVIPRTGELFVSPNTKAFRSRAASPKGGEERLVVGPYSGHLSNFGETLTLKNRAGAAVHTFTTPFDPSDAQRHLVVSEIMYHPAPPDSDAEFIELMNVSDNVTLDLAGVRFTAGVNYTFPAGSSLAPGARIVVPFAAFQNGTRLGNGGDLLKLDDASGSTIKEFRYDDEPPWPSVADGGGPSLVLIAPRLNPDPALASNWRTSTQSGGNPGASDATAFTGDPDADADGDGLGAFLEHALGTPPNAPSAAALTLSVNNAAGPVFSFPRNLAAEDVAFVIELSTGLDQWSAAEYHAVRIATTYPGTGQSLESWAINRAAASPDGRLFVRLRVAKLP